MASSTLPTLPSKLNDFISHVSKNVDTPMTKLLEPFKVYESKLRELYAQDPGNKLLEDGHINIVPLFDGHEADMKIRARNLAKEDLAEAEKYVMPLSDKDRKVDGTPAIVPSLKDFQYNFSIFSEQSLSDLCFDNVVIAGSSALTPLLPIPKEHATSKRAIRNYYHNIVAPASDVDIFLYGLNEDQALEKIKQIERCVKDSILAETTTVRTLHAITIASQHPVRHVQIVLRIYKSISEILTGFDVDISGIAYDGNQVYATPRAVSALITQINHIDLTRRSPSYESRLSKYSHRGFEIYWPQLDRSRIDPTIFERSFPRTAGLARLLVLEKLPKDADRESYNHLRRVERGRPAATSYYRRGNHGNMKEDHADEVAECVGDDQISNYHSFSIPYGTKYHARRIEKLLYTKDLLLNAEWNTKERKVKLHRHPAFFGDAADVFEDCCGFCPEPASEEEKLIAEEEARHHVSGKISFITDDPGRQTTGSFNPITDNDFTDMAYVSNTGRLCQAIVDGDLEAVEECLENGVDPNQRDYTGRTLLHLATMTSTAAIVRCLLKKGAYLVPRIADGQTALHLTAVRGDAEILEALFEKNEENKKAAEKSKEVQVMQEESNGVAETEDSDDGDLLSDDESLDGSEVSAAGSDLSAFLKVETVDKYIKKSGTNGTKKGGQKESTDPSKLEPKDDILDVNAASWDIKYTPAHLATVFGNTEVLESLFKRFGADPSIPIRLTNAYNKSMDAVLSLCMVLNLPLEKAESIIQILISAGAKCSQASMDGTTVFQYFVNKSVEMIELLAKYDQKHAKLALNYISFKGHSTYRPTYTHPLRTAIENGDLTLLDAVRVKIDLLENNDAVKPLVAPSEPEGLDDLRTGIDPDSYRYWYMSRRIREAKEEYQKKLADHKEELQKREMDVPKQNRLKMVQNVLERFKKLEKYLLDRGAKTFVNLHLNQAVKKDDEVSAVVYQQKIRAEQKEYARRNKESQQNTAMLHDFHIANPTEEKRRDYLELFEAAWEGDFERVVELTTKSRAQKNDDGSDGPEAPPLNLSTSDSYGHRAFDLALLRGHIKSAIAMLDIVQAQYSPKRKQLSYVAGSEVDEDSDYESDDQSETNGANQGLNLYARLPASVRNQFTIEDIGQLSTSVKSEVPPLSMFWNTFALKDLVEISGLKIDVDEGNTSIFGYAMYKDDFDLFNKLIDAATKYSNFDQLLDDTDTNEAPQSIFGAGKQAYWHARLALLLRPKDVHHLNVINRSFERSVSLMELLFKTDWPVPVVHPKTEILTPTHREYDRMLKSLLRASSVIFTTTPSLTPLFPAEILTNPEGRKKGRYIAAIGSYKPHMVEISPEIIRQAIAPFHGHHHHKHARQGGAILVDSVEACLNEAGELIQAGAGGHDVVELGELVMLKRDYERRGSARASSVGSDSSNSSDGVHLTRKTGKGKPVKEDGGLLEWLSKGNVIYKSVGMAIMDIVVGNEIVKLADSRGIGTQIDKF